MQDADLRTWLVLHNTPGLSSRSLRKLLTHYPQPAQIRELPPATLAACGLSPAACAALRSNPDRGLQRLIDRQLQQFDQLGIRLLTLNGPDYPALLLETADPPPLLYVRGDPARINQLQLAMVGSRRCSHQGGENAFLFARQLAAAGVAITSGCALGIDTQSHLGALATTDGSSIGVLGTGIDIVYPRRNESLFAQLLERGALVSEFPLGTGPHRALFPQRNRLISGLSLGVIVVEAALQSGSLITARCALEQNREVFAIPGSIHNPGSAGCHHLIRQGAHLVTCVQDVIDQLQHWSPGRQFSLFADTSTKASAYTPEDLAPRENELLTLMGFDPASIDALLDRSGWTINELQGVLMELEIRGLIAQAAGHYQRLAPPP